jgi:hypothetical protein
MFTSRNFKALLPLAASLLLLHAHARAQSGRQPPPPKTLPGMRPAPTPIDYTHFDKVKVVVSEGLYNFVEALNEQGRLGYRLEKTVSYGDPLNYRKYAGLLRLDPGQKKELQAELDAAPPGFRPVRLLFSGAGPDTFYVTVVAERDLDEAAPPKVEYRLVEEVFGFEDEVNRLAAAGSRYVGGGRIQFVKLALLER